MAINIKVDRERMSNLVTVDEYLALLDGDVKTMVSVLSLFVIRDDSGTYLERKEGRKAIGTLTLEEMKSAVSLFVEGSENAAVPPSNGAV